MICIDVSLQLGCFKRGYDACKFKVPIRAVGEDHEKETTSAEAAKIAKGRDNAKKHV